MVWLEWVPKSFSRLTCKLRLLNFFFLSDLFPPALTNSLWSSKDAYQSVKPANRPSFWCSGRKQKQRTPDCDLIFSSESVAVSSNFNHPCSCLSLVHCYFLGAFCYQKPWGVLNFTIILYIIVKSHFKTYHCKVPHLITSKAALPWQLRVVSSAINLVSVSIIRQIHQ